MSVADVLDQESDPATGAEAVVLERRPGYVLAGLREPDGRTLSVVHLDRWPDVGSWYVEGGADCGR